MLLLMEWRPRLLAEWRARQLGPCWFLSAIGPPRPWVHSVLCRYGLPMLPSGGTEPLSTLNPLLFVGLGTTTEGGIKGPTRTRDRTRPRGNGRGSVIIS